MRQFGCIELTLTDAKLLRDSIRPFTKVEALDQRTVASFCTKLYGLLLRLEMEERDELNLKIDETEALLINQFITNEDWDNSYQILTQTWLVLYELGHNQAYPHSGTTLTLSTTLMGESEGPRE